MDHNLQRSRKNVPVEGVVGVPRLANSTVEGVGDVDTGELSLLVDLSDVDLDRGVVLGRDEAVGGRALAGDVKVDNLALQVVGSALPPPIGCMPIL